MKASGYTHSVSVAEWLLFRIDMEICWKKCRFWNPNLSVPNPDTISQLPSLTIPQQSRKINLSGYGRHFNRGGTGREGTHLTHISTSQMERRDTGILETHWGDGWCDSMILRGSYRSWHQINKQHNQWFPNPFPHKLAIRRRTCILRLGMWWSLFEIAAT